MPIPLILGVLVGVVSIFSAKIYISFLSCMTAICGYAFFLTWKSKPKTLFDGKFQPVQDITYGTFLIFTFTAFVALFSYTVYNIILNIF